YLGGAAALFHGFEHRRDGARVDGALEEEGGDLPVDHQLGHAPDVRHGRFGLGAYALDAFDVDAVRAAEVREGVVSGDQDALLLGDGGYGLPAPDVQVVKERSVGAGPLCDLLHAPL